MIASYAPVQGGYTLPSQSGSLLGEAAAFVGDFSQWNAMHNELPMQFLQTAPSNNRGQAGVLLFWLWLHDSWSMLGNGASLSSLGSTNLSNLPLPNDPTGSKLGLIGMDSSGNGSPLTLSNGRGDDPSNTGSILALNNPPLQNGHHDAHEIGSLFSGDPHRNSGSPAPAIDPVPEPAAITLFSVGGLGLLIGWWMRARKPSNDKLTRLAAVG
jgi:hypothetical protein